MKARATYLVVQEGRTFSQFIQKPTLREAKKVFDELVSQNPELMAGVWTSGDTYLYWYHPMNRGPLPNPRPSPQVTDL